MKKKTTTTPERITRGSPLPDNVIAKSNANIAPVKSLAQREENLDRLFTGHHRNKATLNFPAVALLVGCSEEFARERYARWKKHNL